MRYRQHVTEDAVTLEPPSPATSSIVLLHGLGADGWDFAPIVDELELPPGLAPRFVFPHAPLRPVTVNAGYVMRAWYDIREFTPEGRADAAGLAESSTRASQYLDREVERGVAPGRLVLAGFSQGGAVALTAGPRYAHRLAGILALSTYLPFPERLAAERTSANAGLPVLLCHGRQDPVVPPSMGAEARDVLLANGYDVEWHDYPMQHEVCAAELRHVAAWLAARLPVG